MSVKVKSIFFIHLLFRSRIKNMYSKDMVKTRTVKMIDLISGEIIVHNGRCITKVVSLQNQFSPLNLQVTFENGRTVTIDTRSYGVIIE